MTVPGLRFQGGIAALSTADRRALTDRSTSSDPAIRDATAAILARVRQDGDAALRDLARRFDGVELDQLEVPRSRCRAALDQLNPALRGALERAAANIRTVHEACRPAAAEISPEPGIRIGRRPDPLGRVGIYAPGGRAVYPSSVLMGAVPARVAGVGELVLCSPPGPGGTPSEVVLAAAELAGVDRVFAIGGAGAVGALAFGTASVPAVDRIVGPGSAWVAEAKLQVSGVVAIDSPAGPSELLVLADGTADPGLLVRELLAQAEHDPSAAVVAVLVGGGGSGLAGRLMAAAGAEPRAGIVRTALAARGGVLEAASLAEAIDFANTWAAEHLLLVVQDAAAVLPWLRNAGTVFVGSASAVAFGDYLTGANHVLPTGGLARCYSGLSTLDFVRWTTWQEVTPAAAARLAADTALLADAEGLPAHAAAARHWSSR